MKTLVLSYLLVAMACFGLQAQNFDYPYVEDFGSPNEVWLGAPNTAEGTQILPVGTDLWEGNDNNTIHYGAVPSGASNAPVIVFVHGYASSASVWFEGKDNMYADVYRDGYRSAFVSLTPNRHMWTNGNMLSNAIDRITSEYGVSEVMLVGWSKGGVDCDAAVTHFGANSKVSKVFTLSTPHSGTAIAELANSILITFVNIIFMQDNDGTRALQRGYMDYFRSVTDGNPNNNVPFTTLGGWGNGPLNRLDLPQEYLHWNGGAKSDGGNDGVVPYNSSRRPGGTELFSGQRKQYHWWGWSYPGPSQTNLDHFEVTRGGLVWPYIKNTLQNNNRLAIPTKVTPENDLPNQAVTSRMQVVSARNGERNILVAPGTERITLLVGQKAEKPLALRNAQGKKVDLKAVKSEQLERGAQKHQYILESPQAGSYSIESDEPYVAIAIFDGGVTATLTKTDEKRVYNTNDPVNLKVNFENEEGQAVADAMVTGVAVRSMDLEMNMVDEDPIAIEFAKDANGQFVAQWKGMKKPGIYNLSVTAQGAQVQRTVNSSLAVVGKFNEVEELDGEGMGINSVYPNPSNGPINVDLKLKSGDARLTIYNIYGQEVKSFDLSGQEGQYRLTWDARDFDSGLYIIQLSDGENKVSKKVILK